MLKRPKPTDSEKDILQFQNEYLNEKKQSTTFQPSAKVVRVGETSNAGKKQSLFAKSRKKEAQVEDSAGDTKKKGFVMGDIVERHPEAFQGEGSYPIASEESFPKTEKIDSTLRSDGKSIFAKLREEKAKKVVPMSQDVRDFGAKSFILTGSESTSIHSENVQILSQMSKEEIEMERERLTKSLDPKLLEYIRSKRQKTQAMDVEEVPQVQETMEAPPVDVLEDGERKNWLHFDNFEADKFKWMTDVSKNIPKLQPGESFEARFDWKGILLPYVEKDTKSTDNRELYLHGEDPHRPGYTIQELFRLARSNVTQQRIQALNAITGILRIYNQGFYDEISELPISKIFFLLRFALDDTAVAVVEAAAKGLSTLFSNEIDEMLLDTLFETQLGITQPHFKGSQVEGLEKNFSKLTIDSAAVNEDMSNIEEMNDFHLAETDLLKCLLRTNILKRIYFLLAHEEVSDEAVICLCHILIRICREGCARDVLESEDIAQCLVRKYLRVMSELPNGKVQATILKFLRVAVCGVNSPNILKQLDILPLLMDYCHTRRDLNRDFILLQIESYRLIRVWLTFNPAELKLSDFLSAIALALEWHYHSLPFANGSLLLRMHAATLISLLNHQSFKWRSSICAPTLQLCLSKWITLYLQCRNQDVSHNILITCCFELISCQKTFGDFVHNYFQNFLKTEKFSTMWDDLITVSPLIVCRKDRSKIFEALPNLGSVMGDNPQEPQLKLPFNYPGTVILSVLEVCKSYTDLQLNFKEKAEKFLRAFVEAKIDKSSDWFWQHEIRIILNLLQMDLCEKNLILMTSLKFIGILKGAENIGNVKKILESVIFNDKYYNTPHPIDFTRWRSTYWNFYSLNFEESLCIQPHLSSGNWDKELLPRDWPVALLTIFLKHHNSDSMEFVINPQIEDEIIFASLGLLRILEENSLMPVSPSEEFMFLMMPFLSAECRFMDGAIKEVLRERISSLFMRCQKFDFSLKLKAKHDFESVYTVFLNHFQSSSYGDDLFSAMVMVPLAQTYDAKWKKMIWSEHIAVLRFITCTEEQLCGGSINPYLEPAERDVALLKLYNRALNSNSLRVGSIPHKIALHHLKAKMTSNSTKS